MPPKRDTKPKASMGLFDSPTDSFNSVKQNTRWVAFGSTKIRDLLEHTSRMPEEHYGVATEIQRPLDKKHSEEIKNYYRDTPNWVIPPFVFTTDSGSLEMKEGAFTGFNSDLDILDGQHRIQALHLLRDELAAQGEEGAEKLNQLLESSVGLQYVENRNPYDASQLFVDLNKTRKVSEAELMFLDSRDPVVNTVKQTLTDNGWINSITNTKVKVPAPSGNDILTVHVLSRNILKTIEVGLKGRITKPVKDKMEGESGRAETSGKLAAFLEWLADSRAEWNLLRTGEATDIPYEKTKHYAYDTPFLLLMAQAWTNSRDNGPDTGLLSSATESLNLTRSDPNSDMHQLGLVSENGRLKPVSKGDYNGASVLIREKAKSIR